MKKFKKLIALIMVICMVCAVSYADTNTQNATISDAEAELMEYLDSFYHGQKDTYRIMDSNGNNITDEVYRATAPYFATDDSESIMKYMMSKVEAISKRTVGVGARAFVTEDTVNFYTIDVTGTVQEDVGPEIFTGEVTIIIMGEITYNPNTLVISSYAKPRCGYLNDTVTGVNVSLKHFTGSGALDSAKISLTYFGSVSFDGMAGYVPIEFGSYSYSVNVT